VTPSAQPTSREATTFGVLLLAMVALGASAFTAFCLLLAWLVYERVKS